MFDRYGSAVVQAYQEDRRVYRVKDYLRRDDGSAAGVRPRLRRSNRSKRIRTGLRAILARIAGAVAKPQTPASASVTPNERAPTGEHADHAVPQAGGHVVPRARSVGFGEGLHVRPRSFPPPLKR